MQPKHPSDRQRRFFQDNLLGEESTILTVKLIHKEPRGFAVNIRGPFVLALYEFRGSSQTVIDAEWAGAPESNSHLHCCWSEICFAKLSETNAKVKENIGYGWQLSFYANREDAVAGRGQLFWFYLKDPDHKAVKNLTLNEVVDLTG